LALWLVLRPHELICSPENLKVPNESRTGRVVGGVSRQFDSPGDICHLFFFNIALEIRISKVMVGMGQDEDQHFADRLYSNFDGV